MWSEFSSYNENFHESAKSQIPRKILSNLKSQEMQAP